ncbi:hypothetical protein [Micromonospora deserti]|nr:hypothetical protein [Micromonospora deserti]
MIGSDAAVTRSRRRFSRAGAALAMVVENNATALASRAVQR